MNKKTYRLGTVMVTLIFACVAIVLSSATHTGLSSAGSWRGSHLGELEDNVDGGW